MVIWWPAGRWCVEVSWTAYESMAGTEVAKSGSCVVVNATAEETVRLHVNVSMNIHHDMRGGRT